MPFTPAHPAYVLPLARLGLPLSALVVGSMVPDVPMFAGGVAPGLDVERTYAHTHSWLGLATTDVLVGVLVWAVWEFALRPALYDGLPGCVRARAGALADAPPLGRRAVWTVPLAVLVGAATHVGIDEFTHRGRWAATHLGWFRETHAGLPGTSWAQYVGGTLGLAIVAFVLVRGWWRTEPQQRPRLAPRLAAWVWGAPIVVAVVAVAATLAAWASGTPLVRLAYGLVTTGGTAMVLAAVAAAAAWRFVTRRRA